VQQLQPTPEHPFRSVARCPAGNSPILTDEQYGGGRLGTGMPGPLVVGTTRERGRAVASDSPGPGGGDVEAYSRAAICRTAPRRSRYLRARTCGAGGPAREALSGHWSFSRQGGLRWRKTLKCGDVMPGCNAVLEGLAEARILASSDRISYLSKSKWMSWSSRVATYSSEAADPPGGRVAPVLESSAISADHPSAWLHPQRIFRL
jgi:hypothetical protein